MRVLVVDDDQDIREAICESLEEAGYAVSSAQNGALAISALQSFRELPGLILLDFMMPVMDGEHFLQKIQEEPRWAALPIVVLSADRSTQARASKLGARGGLSKPIGLDDLLDTVSRYCPLD